MSHPVNASPTPSPQGGPPPVADFTTVTELSGDLVSQPQVASAHHRYVWARDYCVDKDVLEVACGSGTGLGLLAGAARSLQAGDITPSLVQRVKAHYGDRIAVAVMDATRLPQADGSLDVVILFEALYYLERPELFIAEVRRVLRRGGVLLLTTSNKDMPDFNPSPHSHGYHGVVELEALLAPAGFAPKFFGYWTYDAAPLLQRMLVPVKRAIVASGLMPTTMDGKKALKRLAFGRLVPMPSELTERDGSYQAPADVPPGAPDRRHRVIYCAARRL
jgi:SAM-dependent methyltransferase